MDLDMSIAALSVGMTNAQVAQQMDTSVLKMALDTSSESMEQILDTMAVSIDPNLGQNIDILA